MTEDPEKAVDSEVSTTCKSLDVRPLNSEIQVKRPAEENAEENDEVITKKPALEKPVFGSAAKSLLSFSSFTSGETKSLKELIEDAEKDKEYLDDKKEDGSNEKEGTSTRAIIFSAFRFNWRRERAYAFAVRRHLVPL